MFKERYAKLLLLLRSLLKRLLLNTSRALLMELVVSTAGRLVAQMLPKMVRAFLYARTHQEVDIAGATL